MEVEKKMMCRDDDDAAVHKKDSSVEPSSATIGTTTISITPIQPPFPHPIGGLQQMMGVLDSHRSLFLKKLEREDVDRLYITDVAFWSNLMFALNEQERAKVFDEHGFLRVSARDPSGTNYQLRVSASAASFVLDHEWSKFVSGNGLKEGDTVEGWGYRVGHQLHLVITFSKEEQFTIERLLQELLN